jgi:hypothetical protein
MRRILFDKTQSYVASTTDRSSIYKVPTPNDGFLATVAKAVPAGYVVDATSKRNDGQKTMPLASQIFEIFVSWLRMLDSHRREPPNQVCEWLGPRSGYNPVRGSLYFTGIRADIKGANA